MRVLFDWHKNTPLLSWCYWLAATVSCQVSCVSLLWLTHSSLRSLFILIKEASAAVPDGGAGAAAGAQSGGSARQREAPGRRPEQSAVQLPQQRLQCREPGGQSCVNHTTPVAGLRDCNNSWNSFKLQVRLAHQPISLKIVARDGRVGWFSVSSNADIGLDCNGEEEPSIFPCLGSQALSDQKNQVVYTSGQHYSFLWGCWAQP